MSNLIERLKNEPALVAGVLTSAGLALQDATSWEDAVPLVLAAVIRAFVVPTRKVKKKKEETQSEPII